ncbi:hypothetical protein M3Y99_01914100 [Aphelenchoides fujianensis]|nr:hypothetical protein M3Y99_01914100 [Aphelenchoides fujianensis]
MNETNTKLFVCFLSKNWCNLHRPCDHLDFCHGHVCFVYILLIFVLCLITYLLHELCNELLKWVMEREDEPAVDGGRRRNAHFFLERLR